MQDELTYQKLLEIRSNFLLNNRTPSVIRMSKLSLDSLKICLNDCLKCSCKNKRNSILGFKIEIDNTLKFQEFKFEYI